MRHSSPGGWTQFEDDLLRQSVAAVGLGNWMQCAKELNKRLQQHCGELGQRSGKQCRERWHNSLEDEIMSGPLSAAEQARLTAAFDRHPSKWTQIANKLPGRTANHLKNYVNATTRMCQAVLMAKSALAASKAVRKCLQHRTHATCAYFLRLTAERMATKEPKYLTKLTEHLDLLAAEARSSDLPIESTMNALAQLPVTCNQATYDSSANASDHNGAYGRHTEQGMHAARDAVAPVAHHEREPGMHYQQQASLSLHGEHCTGSGSTTSHITCSPTSCGIPTPTNPTVPVFALCGGSGAGSLWTLSQVPSSSAQTHPHARSAAEVTLVPLTAPHDVRMDALHAERWRSMAQHVAPCSSEAAVHVSTPPLMQAYHPLLKQLDNAVGLNAPEDRSCGFDSGHVPKSVFEYPLVQPMQPPVVSRDQPVLLTTPSEGGFGVLEPARAGQTSRYNEALRLQPLLPSHAGDVNLCRRPAQPIGPGHDEPVHGSMAPNWSGLGVLGQHSQQLQSLDLHKHSMSSDSTDMANLGGLLLHLFPSLQLSNAAGHSSGDLDISAASLTQLCERLSKE